MGKIWLQTSDGKLIHLLVEGPDVNTSDSPTKIPTSVISTTNRCLDHNIVIVHPTYGQITIVFAPANRTGTCNQCGHCCAHLASTCAGPCGYIEANNPLYHKCQHLTELRGSQRGIGKVGGTECSVCSTILNVCKGCTMFPVTQAELDSYEHPICGYEFQ